MEYTIRLKGSILKEMSEKERARTRVSTIKGLSAINRKERGKSRIASIHRIRPITAWGREVHLAP